MILCPDCSSEVPGGSVSCPTCGELLESGEPTVEERRSPGSSEASRAGRASFRFATGTMLASRYRIVSPLGKGGMGEVYRAEDLKLGQVVALKFLAGVDRADAAEHNRLSREVRLARQVSHPNVCRVFDLGEFDGRTFLCMEYIDGEDLASLLRRIGRVPADKASGLARQLATGLAAIHDGGLLHRDLKPSNVMIDGRGRARITDFGVAAPAGEPGARTFAGTPAYMAPEQRNRGEANVQSDLYSLGLVIYEMFTGQPAWPAPVESGKPARLASRADIDPQTEDVLLRCLEPDPRGRPASALHVTAALTGGDPLAAALAAGITLSPEAVAAAPKVGSLRPAVAAAVLIAVFVGLYGALALAGKVMPFRQVPFDRSPEVLVDRTRILLHDLGYPLRPRDWVSGFALESDVTRFLAAYQGPAHSREEARRLLAGDRPPLYEFWYRQSSAELTLPRPDLPFEGPPWSSVEGVYVELDPEGHLYRLEASSRPSVSGRSPESPDWRALLAFAGLEPALLAPAASRLAPPVYADRRAAWDGAYPGKPGLPIHVEAASLQGTPVWFRVFGPWNQARELAPPGEGARPVLGWVISLILQLSWISILGWIALRNLRLGRGDKQGALRLAIFAFSLVLFNWLAGPAPPIYPLSVSVKIAYAAKDALLTWMLYLGFEPYARRLWPERIISWRRLLAGRFRDPLVGRDILIGCLLGLGISLSRYAERLVTGRFEEGSSLWSLSFPPLSGPGGILKQFSADLNAAVSYSLEFMLALLLLRILLRREGFALGTLLVVGTLLLVLGNPGPHTASQWAFVGLQAGLEIFAWRRFGLLAGTATYLTLILCCHYPLTLDPSAWYSGSAIFVVLVVAVLALYGFLTTTAGQSWRTHGGMLDG
jgi:Protein kinase domain